MKISLILAMDRQRAIGRQGQIPWRLSGDMQFFKQATMGKPIIMGRKTWESLGRPLPGRQNIVVTRSEDYVAEGATVVHSIDEALTVAGDANEVMVIGGAQIYETLLPKADRIYLTQVDTEVADADTWFPELDEKDWLSNEGDAFASDDRNEFGFRILMLERR
ncbi:MAG TPA: type 3 dihydrofolate reductase [Gammaproteobacteria bacterium]|nr:type 3 dihydrofolate reductase [Gammaproteobacteria bacterium]